MVTNKLVELKDVLVSSAAVGAVTSQTQLQGMVLTTSVARGQQIVTSQLGTPEAQGLSYRVQTGMRAISIPVDRRNAVGGAIKEGDRVDVIATFDADHFNQMETTPSTGPVVVPAAAPGSTASVPVIQTTKMNLGMVLSPAEVERVKTLTGLDLNQAVSAVSITLLQQVDVLAVDHLLPVTTENSNGGGVLASERQTTTKEVPDSPVITLMVTPADAERIVYAQTWGEITFTLVPALDTTKVETTGRALPNLFK
jgi:Flp pilus assembly protein CpaB